MHLIRERGREGEGLEGGGLERELLGDSDRVLVEVLLYVHRNRKFIRDGSPGRPPPLSHSS